MPTQTEAAQSAIATVRRLCTQWPTLTRQDYHELLTADCLYINMPMPQGRCIGPDQAHDLIAAFVTSWDLELTILHIQGDANAILTERLERFTSKTTPGKVVELHVMGAFELRDGQIAHWRDYFDSRESSVLSS